MAPELVGALGVLVCVVLILGAFLGAYLLGRDSERSRTEAAIARAEAAEARADKAEASASARAHGAAGDTARAVDRALAGDDFDRVLDTIDDNGADPAAGEHGQAGDGDGTQGNEA